MTEVRCTVFNRSGRALAEVVPKVESVSWRLNRVGVAKFFLPWSESACTPANFEFGNRVQFEFDGGLPSWGGVLDLPRTRRQGETEFSAYTGDRLLAWRSTEVVANFRGETPGTVFGSLLTTANGRRPTGLVLGSIDVGGKPLQMSFPARNLLEAVQDLVEDSGHDYEVVSAGGYLFAANWYQSRGTDRSGRVALKDGGNVEQAEMLEQGPIVNHALAVGQGMAWGACPQGTASDMTSQGRYGYRERAQVYGWAHLTTALEASAAVTVADCKNPSRRASVVTTDRDPGSFSAYDVGDTVYAELFTGSSWHLQENVRVLARELRADGKCRLEVEVVE